MPDIDAYLGFREAAESAIRRAIDAAAEARGTDLRRGLEDTEAALADAILLSPDTRTRERLERALGTVRRALGDFELGMLAELGALVEHALADIAT